MGLSNKTEDRLKNMPIIKTRVSKSKDGRYLVHTTEIVEIKPMAYYAAIVADKEPVQTETDEALQALEA